jgi:tRNA (pseudouridine54-N1)-methyltransferase
MRRFVVIGQTALGSPRFSLDDLPGTSGRMDVLVRALQSALLVSHGLRRDTLAYLVLLGDAEAPRTLRLDGRVAEYLRPDERSLGGRIKNALEWEISSDFSVERQGIAVASGGLDALLANLGTMTPFVLEEGGADIRTAKIDARDPVFFVGDHLGFDEATRARIDALGATPLSLGPVSVHADQAIVLVHNELDRLTLPGLARTGSAPP